MNDASCARCHRELEAGDLVVDVRRVTRRYPDGTLATDRADLVAHMECPDQSGGRHAD